MTWFLLTLVILGNVTGDLLKTAAMRKDGEIHEFHPNALARVGQAIAKNGLFWLSIAAYALAFFAVMGLFSVADVSFAVPATAASYVIEVCMSRCFLREKVTARRAMGLVLVICGVSLVAQ